MPYFALLVQKVQHPHLRLYQVNAGLVVVEVYQSPGDLLFHVFLLLQFEHMLEGAMVDTNLCACFDYKMMILTAEKETNQVELLLELLVGVIDAELLKTVDIKRFKSGGG